jgi:hypothetical protein
MSDAFNACLWVNVHTGILSECVAKVTTGASFVSQMG